MALTVSRRAFLRGATPVVAASALTRWAPPSAASPSPTFYVSASGDDSADGLTYNTAWRTIQKANASLPGDGSKVLFRRGDAFYGELAPPFGCEVGAYGDGEKPILTMFKLLNRPQGWTESADGIWGIDLGSPSSHDGYTATTDANIGYLMVDGVAKPARKFQSTDLSEPWDFWCDVPTNMLYVSASANPASLAADIKAAPNGIAYGDTGRVIHCALGQNDIHDVHVTGTGGCGIGGVGADVHVHDCLIDYIGGSELGRGTGIRYGNGIEHWVNVKRWLIEDNEIAQVYDAAWSPQGRAGDDGSWEDLTVRNNHIHDCTQSFELWSTGSDSAGGFQRILVEGNRCERAGNSVFSDVRPDRTNGVHLLTYHWETPADVTVQGNTFDDVVGAYSFHAYNPVGYVTRNNTIRLRAGTKMQYQFPETVEDAPAWQATTGRETGSTITVLS